MAIAGALIELAPLKASAAFRRLWIGRTFSGFGGQMTIVAVMFQVWQLTRSPVWTGAVGIAQAVPMVVVGLIGGGLADRIDRRRLVLRTTVGQFAVSILLALQGFVGHLPVLGVLALVSLQTCFVAVGGPAGHTFTPRLLPKQQVSAGLALTRISSQAAMLVGPAVAGLLLGWVGVGGCYLTDAISFGASFYGVFGLPPMRPEGEVGRPGIHGIADGLRFVASKATVRGALIIDLAATVLSMPISLFPLINAERFGNNPRTLGLFLSAIAVGGMLASVLSGLFTRYHRPGLVMLGGALGLGCRAGCLRLVAEPVGGPRLSGDRRRCRHAVGDLSRNGHPVGDAGCVAGTGGRRRADGRGVGSRPRQHARRHRRRRHVGGDGAGQRRVAVCRRSGCRRRRSARAEGVPGRQDLTRTMLVIRDDFVIARENGKLSRLSIAGTSAIGRQEPEVPDPPGPV